MFHPPCRNWKWYSKKFFLGIVAQNLKAFPCIFLSDRQKVYIFHPYSLKCLNSLLLIGVKVEIQVDIFIFANNYFDS